MCGTGPPGCPRGSRLVQPPDTVGRGGSDGVIDLARGVAGGGRGVGEGGLVVLILWRGRGWGSITSIGLRPCPLRR